MTRAIFLAKEGKITIDKDSYHNPEFYYEPRFYVVYGGKDNSNLSDDTFPLEDDKY